MQQYWLILILLVDTFSSFAHGRTYELINKDFMTSLPAKKDAVRQTLNSNLNFDNIVTIRKPSSAVRDWSLVCQQLCGAALGGALCASSCKILPFLPFTVQLKNAEEIMDSKKALICPELCGIQLGGDVCICENYNANDPDVDMKAEQKTNVCAIICDHNGVTLTGCTPCKKDKNIKENMITKKFENLFQQQQQQVVPLAGKTLTTPNWKRLCAALCKTGDGGSLCNCDLSPFII